MKFRILFIGFVFVFSFIFGINNIFADECRVPTDCAGYGRAQYDSTNRYCGTYQPACENPPGSDQKACRDNGCGGGGGGGSSCVSNQGSVCYSAPNNCGDRIPGSIECGGGCDRQSGPPDRACYSYPTPYGYPTPYAYPYPTPPSPMTGSLSATSCTIALGLSSCAANITWSTTNAVSTSAVTSSWPAANTTVANGNSGSQGIGIPYSSRAFYLYNNGVLLAQATSSASCVAGTVWNGSTCVLPPISGSCGATHYICFVGSSINNAFSSPAYTWTCTGANGGANASCGECSNGASNPPTCNIGVTTINASSTTIASGESTNITWNSSQASCVGTNFSTGNAPSGSVIVSPVITTTYTVTCDATNASAVVTVRKKPRFIEN